MGKVDSRSPTTQRCVLKGELLWRPGGDGMTAACLLTRERASERETEKEISCLLPPDAQPLLVTMCSVRRDDAWTEQGSAWDRCLRWMGNGGGCDVCPISLTSASPYVSLLLATAGATLGTVAAS